MEVKLSSLAFDIVVYAAAVVGTARVTDRLIRGAIVAWVVHDALRRPEPSAYALTVLIELLDNRRKTDKRG